MIAAPLRQPCVSFTAEGTYALKLDFLDEVATPNLPYGAHVSIVAIKPSADAPVAADGAAVTQAAPAPPAMPTVLDVIAAAATAAATAEAPGSPAGPAADPRTSHRLAALATSAAGSVAPGTRAPGMAVFNPLAPDAAGGYSGPPATAVRPPILTTTSAAATTAPVPAAAAPEPATANGRYTAPAAPANFTYTYNEANAHGGLATGAAHIAMSTVTSITETLSYLLPLSKRRARGSNTADAAAAVAVAGGGVGQADGSKPESAIPARVLTSKQLSTHANYVHPTPRHPKPDNVYMVFNVNNSLLFVDYSGVHRGPLEKLSWLRSRPLVHDINQLTRSADRLDVLVGMSSGEVLLHDPFGARNVRFNKGGVLNKSSVTAVRWVPGSDTRALVAFSDGALLLLDTERDDAPMSIESNSTDLFYITTPKSEKQNPVVCWQVGRQAVTAFAFSIDCKHLATVGRDGYLRIFDFDTSQYGPPAFATPGAQCALNVGAVRSRSCLGGFALRLIVSFRSFFGALTCVAWSPDGKYIVTGGEDDLVSVWAVAEQRLVVRCQGHQSWVADVAFDPWKCDESVYRFGSVAEDAKLALWDFSVNALHRPRTQTAVVRQRSLSSMASGRRPSTLASPETVGEQRGSFQLSRTVDAASMHDVPVMEPLMIRKIHAEPLSHLAFREDAVVTACRRGQVKVWLRPNAAAGIAVAKDVAEPPPTQPPPAPVAS